MSGSAAAIAPGPVAPDLDGIFEDAGREWNVDPNLLRSVAGVESGGNVATPNSKAGAQGLMQFMPGTAKAIGVEDPHDPVQAIFGAAKLLNENLNRYGNVEDALRAYNGGTDPAKWSNPETAAYPGKVAAIYGRLTGAQSQDGNAPAPKPYQIAAADTGTMSDVAPPPDAPPVALAEASPAAGMDLAPHPPRASGVAAPGAPVDVTALPPADFFKLTTGGSAPAAANSNTPAAPPDVTAMSPADFFKATTAPAGSVPAKPSDDPYADQTDDLSMIGRGAVAEASHLANRVYSGANWVDQHVPLLGSLDKAAGLDPGAAAAATKAYTGQNDQTYGGSGFYQGGKIGTDLAAGLPLGEGVGLAARGLSYAGEAIPSVAGRFVQGAGNLLSGDTGATSLLGRTATSATKNALQGGIIAGAYGDSPVQGAEYGAVLGPAGEFVAPAVGRVAGKILGGGSGLVDRGLTAIGAPPRPVAALPEPEPTITQKWNGAPAQPAFPSAPAEPAPPPGSAAAERQALIEQAQRYSVGQNFSQSTAPREPMSVSSGAPPAEYTTTAPAPDNKLAPASAPENKLQGAGDIPAPADVAPPPPISTIAPDGFSAAVTGGDLDKARLANANAPDPAAPVQPVRKLATDETSQFMQPETINDAQYILPNGKLLGAGDEDHEYIAGTLGYGTNGQGSIDAMMADTGAIRVNAARAMFGEGTPIQIGSRPPTPSQVKQLGAYLEQLGGADIEYNGDYRTVANADELSRFIKEAKPVMPTDGKPIPPLTASQRAEARWQMPDPGAPAPVEASPPPAAPAAPAPVDLGGGRLAPSYDANRLAAAPADDRAAPTFSPNRLQAAVPLERADPAIGAPGMTPPISPEIHAATQAMLNPQPQSMGAASSSRDAANPVPPMSAREAAASRNTGNLQRLTEPAPSGRDTTIYVPGSTPTEAEVAGDASVSRQQEAIRQKNPQPFDEQWNRNNLARVDHFEERMGTDDTVRLAEEARDAQAEQDLASAWSNKTDADAQPVADLGQQILAGRMGKLPPVRDAIGKALDGLYDADGNLETDPEMLYGARDNIAYLLSKTAQQEKPGLAKATAQLMQLKDALDGVIEEAAPGYKQFLANYAAASKPIDTQQILQSFRPSLTDGRGTMTLQRVKNMMTAIVKAQKAPGVNQAKSIDPDTMDALWNIRDDLRRLDNRDLGKARGSDTNQVSWFGKKLGLAGLHVAAAHVAPLYGNMGINAAQNYLEQANIKRMTNKLTNPILGAESDRNAP